MSPNSYDGEYLKREKCFINLQEQKNVFVGHLQPVTLHGYGTNETSRCHSRSKYTFSSMYGSVL